MNSLSFSLFLFYCSIFFGSLNLCLCGAVDYEVKDLFVPNECESVAGAGDHLLIEYSVHFSNGTDGAYLRKPSQLFHLILDSKVT
jgi:hypothetical protein